MNKSGLFSGWLIGALAAAIALTFSTALSAQTPKRGGILVYMVAGDAPSFDAHREQSYTVIHPIGPYYSLLIRVDPLDPNNGKFVCDVCTKWTVSKDQRTYTFKIRKGIRFHDGSPFSARDVVATYKKIIFPAEGVISQRKQYYEPVTSVSNPDKYTVVFKLKFATPAFIPSLASPFNFLYSADKLAKDMHWYEKNLVGTGPFKHVSYSPGATWVGERNKDYHRKGLPYLDGIKGIIARKQNVRVNAIRGGRAMIEFRGFPPAARDDLVRALGDKITVQEGTWNCFYGFAPNPYKKPFSDPRVRRAMNLALDRWNASNYISKTAIVKTVGGITYPGSPLAPSRKQLETLDGYGRDIKASRAKARRLLKEAGVPKGFKFKLWSRSVDQPYKILDVWLIDQWAQIGLDVERIAVPGAAWFKELRGGNGPSKPASFDVAASPACESVVNPTLDLSTFLSWDRSDKNNANNEDRVFDAIYDKQVRETDFKKQKELIWQMEKRMNERTWWGILFWWQRTIPHSSVVRDWKITPSHYLNQQLEVVWLDQ